MSIFTYTRERQCKDCNNLKYYHPNPDKYYRRHKCIVKDCNKSPRDKAGHCDMFDWNPVGMPGYINLKRE